MLLINSHNLEKNPNSTFHIPPSSITAKLWVFKLSVARTNSPATLVKKGVKLPAWIPTIAAWINIIKKTNKNKLILNLLKTLKTPLPVLLNTFPIIPFLI